jgi:hypothetical protein
MFWLVSSIAVVLIGVSKTGFGPGAGVRLPCGGAGLHGGRKLSMIG